MVDPVKPTVPTSPPPAAPAGPHPSVVPGATGATGPAKTLGATGATGATGAAKAPPPKNTTHPEIARMAKSLIGHDSHLSEENAILEAQRFVVMYDALMTARHGA